jgi:hypothetical protein
MPLDPRIALGVQPMQLQMPDPNAGMNSLARMMQIRGMQDEQQVNALTLQGKQRDMERRNKLDSLLGVDYAKPEERESALMKGGFLEEAGKLSKERRDATSQRVTDDAKAVETAQKRVESWGQTMGWVRQNPTPESAVSAVRYLVTIGVIPQEMAQSALSGVGNDPQSITKWATQGFQAALSAKDQLPKYDTRNLGGTTQTTAIDPVSGQLRVVNSVANTQSPDNKASVGAQYANAAATRDIAAATREATLEGTRLKNEELRGKLDDSRRQRQAGESSIAAQIGVIDKALAHPGRTTATGLSSVADPRNFVPGTDASDFRAVLDQIGGAAFLQAFESLKGGGQITEVEGKKATDAIARLSRSQSDKEFEQSLNDLRSVMTAGYKRSTGRDYGNSAAPQGKPASNGPAKISSDAEYNALPSGTVFIGPDGKQRRKP